MISEFLQSVEAAEQDADHILEDAEQQSRRIREEALAEAERYRRQIQEEFSRRAQEQREQIRQQEDIKKLAARESLALEIGKLRSEAAKKEDQVINFLLAEVL